MRCPSCGVISSGPRGVSRLGGLLPGAPRLGEPEARGGGGARGGRAPATPSAGGGGELAWPRGKAGRRRRAPPRGGRTGPSGALGGSRRGRARRRGTRGGVAGEARLLGAAPRRGPSARPLGASRRAASRSPAGEPADSVEERARGAGGRRDPPLRLSGDRANQPPLPRRFSGCGTPPASSRILRGCEAGPGAQLRPTARRAPPRGPDGPRRAVRPCIPRSSPAGVARGPRLPRQHPPQRLLPSFTPLLPSFLFSAPAQIVASPRLLLRWHPSPCPPPTPATPLATT